MKNEKDNMASPQVTDEQLLVAFNSAPFGLPGLRAVAALSAPPAAETPPIPINRISGGKFENGAIMLQVDGAYWFALSEGLMNSLVEAANAAASQEAKPVADDWLESARSAEKSVEAVMRLADFYAWRQTDESRSAARKPLLAAVQSLAAAPQEQAPAVDRDAVIEEVAKHVWQYKAAEVIPSWLMLEVSGICKWILQMQNQPKQEQAPADKDAIRNAALEEAARIAEGNGMWVNAVSEVRARETASKIRALQSQPQQVEEGGHK